MSKSAPANTIRIHGARTHNLRDIDLTLPREAWTVVCGVSGSGKSSLVLDTLGAESRRRYLGTLRHAVQAVDLVSRPDVDRIEGLPPAVTVGFSSRRPGIRETLGTVTEITHALRSLFMRAAVPHCPTCEQPVEAWPREAITARLLAFPEGTRLVLSAPRGRGPDALKAALAEGFVRVRLDGGEAVRIEELDAAALGSEVRVAVVVDRLVVKPDAGDRFAASIDQALVLGDGRLRALVMPRESPHEDLAFAEHPHCGTCDTTYAPLSTAVLSFNSPAGACPTCQGRGLMPVLLDDDILPPHLRVSRAAARLAPSLPPKQRRAVAARLSAVAEAAELDRRSPLGALPLKLRRGLLKGSGRTAPGLRALLEKHGRFERLATLMPCEACAGTRLSPYARAARLGDRTLPELEALPAGTLNTFLQALDLGEALNALIRPSLEDARARLDFLTQVGLDYLSTQRSAATLSGGELGRARLAAACAARMSGLLYLLDEPTAGLHPADRAALRAQLRTLVNEGNTVVCVEHDPAVLDEADFIVELGPGAGAKGGALLAAGPAEAVRKDASSPTVSWLQATPAAPRTAPRFEKDWVQVKNATLRNVSEVACRFPLAGLTAITGVSGAGKSTLALDVITPVARAMITGAGLPKDSPCLLEGIRSLDRLAVAGRSAARHPRATPGSVLGVLGLLRTLYASTLEARARGWAPSWFSTNVAGGGRCSACKGTGQRAIVLRDLPEHRVPCDVCGGSRYRAEIERVRVKGYSMADVLRLSIEQAASIFRDLPRVRRPLQAAADVGLGYIPVGEPTTRLSGGEALRLRLAAALGRGGRTRTLYVLDEPCAGLHPTDVAHLVEVLLRLSQAGNAVLAVEHHVGLIRCADHVIELGPGPGEAGGRVVYEGPPAGLATAPEAATGRYL